MIDGQHGPLEIRKAIAAGKHLSTLAFSEHGSRSQFWASLGTATADGKDVRLTGKKSFVTSAHHADSYVWSSKPTAGAELTTLWLVPRTTAGLRIEGAFDGLGLRGNDSAPVTAEDARVPVTARLGADGNGFGIMMGTVLPWFNVLSAAASSGLMETAVERTAKHAAATTFAHAGSSVADLPTVRAFVARMRIKTDQTKALNQDYASAAMGSNRGRYDAARAREQGRSGRSRRRGHRSRDARVRRRGVSQGRRHRARVPRCARGAGHGADHRRALRLHREGRVRPAAVLMRELVLGAVAYDAKVIPIWDGFRAWFAKRDFAFDYILYTSYERQVDAHLRGDIHVAWNSPLAWLEAERLATKHGRIARTIAMRDTDRDLTSVIIARADGPVKSLADVKRVGVGAADSPQATLIPLDAFAEAGVVPEVIRHDVLVGKHGDHIGGERDAVKALLAGTVDAACLIDGNRLAFAREGLLPANATRVLHHTGAYDHCNMTVLEREASPKGDGAPAEIARFGELLLGMSYDDPEVRPLLDMEGLKVWMPGRTSGYALLERAVDRFGTLEAWLAAR